MIANATVAVELIRRAAPLIDGIVPYLLYRQMQRIQDRGRMPRRAKGGRASEGSNVVLGQIAKFISGQKQCWSVFQIQDEPKSFPAFMIYYWYMCVPVVFMAAWQEDPFAHLTPHASGVRRGLLLQMAVDQPNSGDESHIRVAVHPSAAIQVTGLHLRPLTGDHIGYSLLL